MIDWSDLSTGGHRLTCPSCGRNPKDRTLGVTVEPDGHGVAHCHRCHYVETHHDDRTHRMPGAAPARPVAASKRETLAPQWRDFFARCSGLPSTTGEQYLTARGCRLPPADGDLRYCADLRHPSGYVGPALVALLTDAVDGTPRTLHFTWVLPSGAKAAVDPPRRLLAGHRKAGAVCRLWPDDMVTHGLGVAEGIETALALAWANPPVWAAIDAGNLGSFPVLPGIESLTIAADHDAAGTQAADACASRWHAAGREVFVVTAPSAGADLNDVAREVPA